MSGGLLLMGAAVADAPAGSLIVSVYPLTLVWEFASVVFRTEFAEAMPEGGTPPYSYAWSATGDASALNPTLASTRFLSPTGTPATATVTVTDAALNVVPVNITIS
jgi:hypothetical protein